MFEGLSLTDRIMGSAKKHLAKIVQAAAIKESHGLGHMLAVVSNLQKALESNSENKKGLKIDQTRLLAL